MYCMCCRKGSGLPFSTWEHPTVHTYDPWGLGSGQSERTTHITRAPGGGGIGHGLVGTRLSWVNRVLFENISWEESRFLNPHKSKTNPKIVKPSMVSRHGTYMSRNFFHPFWRKFYYKPLTNRSFSQRSLVVPIGKRGPLVGETKSLPLFALYFLLRATWNGRISMQIFKLIQGSFDLFIH